MVHRLKTVALPIGNAIDTKWQRHDVKDVQQLPFPKVFNQKTLSVLWEHTTINRLINRVKSIGAIAFLKCLPLATI